MMEYVYVSRFHPKDLTSTSFCFITHSPAFTIAMIICILEYWIEWYFFPSLKANFYLYFPALICVLFFQFIRSLSMFTAGEHFHHSIRFKREEKHKLVTHGIYAYSRHPSYFGWFWWAVCMPVMLGNPLCIIGYALKAHMFFVDRIEMEEETLIEFFGQDYINYRNTVPVGIPFIKSANDKKK